MNSETTTPALLKESEWGIFWHRPLRAESLALVRIALGLALLSDLLFQYLPNLAYFYGPEGVAPAGINDEYLAKRWRWTILFFHTDDMKVVGILFAVWLIAVVCMLIGWKTRWMTILAWFMTMCFLNRNPNLKNGGDDTMQVTIFLMMFLPAGQVFSLDAWLRRSRGETVSHWISPWPLRLLQLQLCVIYFTTGLAKLRGDTWLDGTSLFNALNDATMTRWSYAQLPIPFHLTQVMTWTTLAWESCFVLLVMWSRTRKWALYFGICLHLGIWISLEVGWFSLYTLSLYPAWITSAWWEKRIPTGEPLE